MDWNNVLSEVLKAALIAAIPAALALFTAAMSRLQAWLEAQTKNEWLKIIEREAFQIVAGVQQAVVDPLKEAAKDGKIDATELANIKATAQKALESRLKGIPAHLFPDLGDRLGHAIEAAIPQAKAIANPPSSPVSK